MSNPAPTLTPDQARFSTTCWTLVLAARDGDLQRDLAFDWLCRTYWFPTYAFLRKKNHSPEDAADLTQGFFAKLLANDALANLQRDGGARFSTFLLVALQNFTRQQHARATAQKRGGTSTPISLDQARAENWFGAEPATHTTPEQSFARNWARTVVENAMQSLADECAAAGKSPLFAALSPFLSREPEPGEYQRLGESLDMKPGTVAVAVHRLRTRFRETLQRELADGGDPAEELHHLRRSLAGE